MNNAEINYLSSESVCRLFAIEKDRDVSFYNGYEIRKNRLIKDLISLLDAKNENSLNKKNYFSTCEDVIKIKKNSASTSLDVLYRVKVLNMISSKEIISNPLTSDVLKDTLQRGKKVELIISNANKELKTNLTLEKGQSYSEILDLIINEINLSGFELKSKLVFENRKKVARLNVKSKPGKQYDFEISLSGDELLKNMFNFDVISNASDYVYEIAGKKYNSTSKDIDVSKSLSLTIVNLGESDIISTFDIDEVVKDLNKVTTSYNLLLDYMCENKNYTVVSKELKRIKDSLNSIVYELSTLGIDVSLNLRISLDKKRMKKKIIQDPTFAKKYINKEGGLLDKLLYLMKTTSIDMSQVSRDNDKKAMVVSMLDRVNGKTISHEPYFMIGDNKLE